MCVKKCEKLNCEYCEGTGSQIASSSIHNAKEAVSAMNKETEIDNQRMTQLAQEMAGAITRDFPMIEAAQIVNKIKENVAQFLESRLQESEVEMKMTSDSMSHKIRINHEALNTLYGNN